MDQLSDYHRTFPENQQLICSQLRTIIDANLPNSSSKLYHGAPVWFIDDNPIVGYSQKKAGIALLFWSGQSFQQAGLSAIGNFKAAEIVYADSDSLEQAPLVQWLAESKQTIWNYRDIRANEGKLTKTI